MTTWEEDNNLNYGPTLTDALLFSSPQFSGLYIVSLVAILIGFITFNAVATTSVQSDAPLSSLPTCQESHTNHQVEPEEVAAEKGDTWTENNGKAEARRNKERKMKWNKIKEQSTKM